MTTTTGSTNVLMFFMLVNFLKLIAENAAIINCLNFESDTHKMSNIGLFGNE